MSSHSEGGRGLAADTLRSGTRRGDATAERDDISVAEPSRDDVLRTVFGLGGHDVRTHDAVGANPGSTTRELARCLDRDRSNVNRSLNRLREVGLVTRSRRLLDGGGHVYQYSARPETASEDVIARAVDRWRSAALDAVGAGRSNER